MSFRKAFKEILGGNRRKSLPKSDRVVNSLPARSSLPAALASSPMAFQRSSVFSHDLGGNAIQRSSMLTFDLSQSWVFKLPQLVLAALKIIFLPFFIIYYIVDFAVSALVLFILGSTVLWYLEIIEDQLVVDIFNNVGERGLAILRASGVPL